MVSRIEEQMEFFLSFSKTFMITEHYTTLQESFLYFATERKVDLFKAGDLLKMDVNKPAN